MQLGRKGRAARSAAVGARERLPVGRGDVRVGGGGRAPRGAAVDARERLPVELAHGRVSKKIQTLRAVELGNRKRLSKDDTRTRAASRRVCKNRQRRKTKNVSHKYANKSTCYFSLFPFALLSKSSYSRYFSTTVLLRSRTCYCFFPISFLKTFS